MMAVTDPKAIFSPVNHSHHPPVALLDENIIVRNLVLRCGEARGRTPWVRLYFKFLALHFLSTLSRMSSLDASTGLLLPFIMVKLIMLNMWAILTREWPFALRIRPWCVKCSLRALVWWPWGGLTASRKDKYIPLRSLREPLGHDLQLVVESLGP